ncbi:hypothetical protein Bbelb_430610 [Branchiostoma belcheri]|nr:hypothetical protein Bbelb_430610 [Branchiostoma belcheri]
MKKASRSAVSALLAAAGPFPCKCARCPGFRPCQGAKRGVRRGGRERDITRLFTGQRHGGIWRCRDVTIPSVPLCHLTVGAIRRPILLLDLSRSSLPQSSGKRDCLQQVMRIETGLVDGLNGVSGLVTDDKSAGLYGTTCVRIPNTQTHWRIVQSNDRSCTS